ncbi:Gcp-like domain-containing protein [Cyathus striatus]|nr:Gcp-like domain-containing protein [Cyathus striatus]
MNSLSRSLRVKHRYIPLPIIHRSFTVLAVETSADDTCAAVVTSSRYILSNVVTKQHDLHEKYGGIEPLTAIHAHQRNLPYTVQKALDTAKVDIVTGIDGIAVTQGPGMPGCLNVGMNAAKTLAAALNKPFIGVHHMQGHALTALLTSSDPPNFPFLTLLVSGGHTLILLAQSDSSFKILSTTADESIGRTFDKVSRLLALKWTALGPGDALEKFCAEEPDIAHPSIVSPRLPTAGKAEFSFASVHSWVERFVHEHGGIEKIDIPTKRALARGFQAHAIAHLEDKIKLAIKWCHLKNIPVTALVVSGGVASNSFLRQRRVLLLTKNDDTIRLIFPPPHLCTDNAVMIGWASLPRFLSGNTDRYDIDARPKWSIEEI